MKASPLKTHLPMSLGLALLASLALAGCDRRSPETSAPPRSDTTATPEIVPASPASGPASGPASDPPSSLSDR